MRLYESDGKIVAALDETIELCDSGDANTLQGYRETLLEKVAGIFDRTVVRAALKGMEEKAPMPAPLCAELPETVTASAKNVIDAPKIVIDDAKNDASNSKTVSEAEKPERKKRKDIDAGKIIALKNAGWPNKEIAAEMHIEPQQVANVVYRHRKKNEVIG